MGRELLAVGLGGAIGALARWALGEVTPAADGFPWTTFATNVVGCALLALLPTLAAVRTRHLLAVTLGPGLLGGFTTLSAYAEESRALLADGRLGLAAAYLVGTALTCVVAVVAAHRLGRAQVSG